MGGVSSSTHWGGPLAPPSGDASWNNQQAFPSSTGYDNSLWAQVMAPQAMQATQQQSEQGSLLPVPYQNPAALQPIIMSPDLSTLQLGQLGGALVPAPPDEEGRVYVPPMYTKPRPLVPRYRIISGFISFIVVIGLLCSGAVYYAKATGRLSFIRQIFNPTYSNLQPSPAATLAVPSVTISYGPAATIINSATTASSINTDVNEPRIASVKFRVGDPIYVTYSVHPKNPGIVTFKWYLNGLYYITTATKTIDPDPKGLSGYTQTVFAHPAEGMVQLYWNDKTASNQLAITLYFVVEPQ